MSEPALNLTNLALCIALNWACLCRLNLLHRLVDWRPRAMFTLLVLGATAHGAAPWLLGEHAGLGGTTLTATVLLGLLLTSHRWRQGAPEGLTVPGELDDTPTGEFR